jgi:hypothetical protein
MRILALNAHESSVAFPAQRAVGFKIAAILADMFRIGIVARAACLALLGRNAGFAKGQHVVAEVAEQLGALGDDEHLAVAG